MLSLTAEYALRAVLYIADHSGNGLVRVEPMAADLGLPRNYLSKTLNQLAKQGVLASLRGPTGGFRLAQPADELTLAQVVEGFDPDATRRGCLLGRPKCSSEEPCPAHYRWQSVAAEVNAFFAGTTVADLLGDSSVPGGNGLTAMLHGRRASPRART
jgi:Rrf2 family protein